jgi:hypothetical protein
VVAAASLVCLVGLGLYLTTLGTGEIALPSDGRRLTHEAHIRQTLFAELQPVALANCVPERFGEADDGGYVMCANLLDAVEAGYSYGISGYDGWGCAISTRLDVRVHQYDCFDTRTTSCATGDLAFHAECVAGSTYVDAAARPFDTVARQLARNGDAIRRLVVKMDVEGAEWDALSAIPHETLARIDQLVVEFHQVQEERFIGVLRRLKRHFHVVNVHYNNYSCDAALAPFPAWAYEVLLVNKRIARVDPSGRPLGASHPLNSPNAPLLPDCQPAPAS